MKDDAVLREWYDPSDMKQHSTWTWRGTPIRDLDPDELLEALTYTLDKLREFQYWQRQNEDLAKLLGG